MELESLTKRQHEILQLIAKGCSNSDIARLLEISPNTVKSHIATILNRLNVSNRTEASMLLQSEDWQSVSAIELQPQQQSQSNIPIALLPCSNEADTAEINQELSNLLTAWGIFDVCILRTNSTSHDNLNAGYLIEIHNVSSQETNLMLKFQSPDDSRERLILKTKLCIDKNRLTILRRTSASIYKAILSDQTTFTETQNRCLYLAMDLLENSTFSTPSDILTLCDKVININPENAVAYALKATTLYRSLSHAQTNFKPSDISQIGIAAKTALSLNPNNAWSQLAFAYYCLLSSDLALAKRHAEAAVKINPCQYRASQILGQIYAFEGDIKTSILVFTDFLITFPDSDYVGSTYSSLGLIYYCARDYKNSKQACLRALMYQDAPKPAMYMTLISIAELQQDKETLCSLLDEFKKTGIDETTLKGNMLLAKRVVPPQFIDDYFASLKRAGIKF